MNDDNDYEVTHIGLEEEEESKEDNWLFNRQQMRNQQVLDADENQKRAMAIEIRENLKVLIQQFIIPGFQSAKKEKQWLANVAAEINNIKEQEQKSEAKDTLAGVREAFKDYLDQGQAIFQSLNEQVNRIVVRVLNIYELDPGGYDDIALDYLMSQPADILQAVQQGAANFIEQFQQLQGNYDNAKVDLYMYNLNVEEVKKSQEQDDESQGERYNAAFGQGKTPYLSSRTLLSGVLFPNLQREAQPVQPSYTKTMSVSQGSSSQSQMPGVFAQVASKSVDNYHRVSAAYNGLKMIINQVPGLFGTEMKEHVEKGAKYAQGLFREQQGVKVADPRREAKQNFNQALMHLIAAYGADVDQLGSSDKIIDFLKHAKNVNDQYKFVDVKTKFKKMARPDEDYIQRHEEYFKTMKEKTVASNQSYSPFIQ